MDYIVSTFKLSRSDLDLVVKIQDSNPAQMVWFKQDSDLVPKNWF
jgi:hypothetical protein